MSNSPSEPDERDRVSGFFIPLHTPNDTGGMQLRDWCTFLLSRIWLIVSTTAFVAIVSIGVAFLTTPVFRAEVLLAPNSEQTDSSFLSGLASQFDTLSSVAGLDLEDDLAVEVAVATLKSRDFTARFIQSGNLMPILFAEKWNSESDSWEDSDPQDVPTDWDAYDLFDSKIRDVISQSNGLLLVRIDWRDRVLAAKWANQLVADLNELMRRRAIEEAAENISFLQQELQSTNIVELQSAIARLIEEQVKKAMLARVRDQYSFRVIDPAVVPDADQFIWPNRILIILLGVFSGFLLGVVASIVTKSESRDPA